MNVFFGFFFIHAKAAAEYSRNEYYRCHRSFLTGLMKAELRIPSGTYNLHFVSNSQNWLLSMRVLGLRNSAHTFLHCFPIDNRRHTYIYISCEISIEDPSVGSLRSPNYLELNSGIEDWQAYSQPCGVGCKVCAISFPEACDFWHSHCVY